MRAAVAWVLFVASACATTGDGLDAGRDDGAAGPDDAGSGDDAGDGDDVGRDDARRDAGYAVDGGAVVDGGGLVDGGPTADSGVPVDGGAYTSPPRPVCAGAYAAPTVAGTLADAALVETSGLAASLTSTGVLWAHNDSGDGARVFAVGDDGAALGRVALDGVAVVDVEDVATAPCPDRSGPCVWLADTGDNLKERGEVALHVFAEPSVPRPTGIGDAVAYDVVTYRFRYPVGSVDVEAMVVAPDASTVWLFEKVDGDAARVFALTAPFDPGVVGEAVVVATIAPPGVDFVAHGREITAADLHPTGTRLALRVYSGVFEYRFADGQGVADLADVAPSLVTYGPFDEPQGEAIAYDGDALFTASEDPQQTPGQALHRYDCE